MKVPDEAATIVEFGRESAKCGIPDVREELMAGDTHVRDCAAFGEALADWAGKASSNVSLLSAGVQIGFADPGRPHNA